ncbi:SgcJ/EcaC family oxidoreductase [Alsobacter ponti]|nr:SgcJ/EcaC family oxidoreductase [Alsobacter ponti]
MTTQRQREDEATIRGMIANWSRAVERHDSAAAVAAYTPDTVLYDLVPPGKTVGAQAIKAVWDACFPYFPKSIRSEHKDLVVEVDGDVAFVHGLHHFVPEPADHPSGSTWMRVTACYKRIDGQWRVAHEHVSIPFDPMTNKAAFIGPDGATTDMRSAPSATTVHRVTPHLVCRGAAEALDFYARALGAREILRMPTPDGRLMHASIEVNDSTVMLCDEFPEMGNKAPTTLHGTPVTIHLPVNDVDASIARAEAAGARVVMPAADMFWGDRYGLIEDPFGHRWSFGTPKRSLTPDELAEAAQAAMANPGACPPDA